MKRHFLLLVLLFSYGLGSIDSASCKEPSDAPVVAGGTTSDTPSPFRAALTRQIKRAWFPPRGTMNTLRIVVTFKVNKAGELSDLKVASSSGNAVADKAALEAVERAAPFRNLPEKDSSYDEPITFTFDYHVFNPGFTPHSPTGNH
jgi:TonB family protein